jgi:hypothetical protein
MHVVIGMLTCFDGCLQPGSLRGCSCFESGSLQFIAGA